MTPLLFCISKKNRELMQALLDKKVNPNQQIPGSMTPLTFCISCRDFPGVQMLLNAGANPKLTDSSGITPIAAANITGQHEIYALIMGTIQINEKHMKNKGIDHENN